MLRASTENAIGKGNPSSADGRFFDCCEHLVDRQSVLEIRVNWLIAAESHQKNLRAWQ